VWIIYVYGVHEVYVLLTYVALVFGTGNDGDGDGDMGHVLETARAHLQMGMVGWGRQ
jgi:hypothetical protein